MTAGVVDHESQFSSSTDSETADELLADVVSELEVGDVDTPAPSELDQDALADLLESEGNLNRDIPVTLAEQMLALDDDANSTVIHIALEIDQRSQDTR